MLENTARKTMMMITKKIRFKIRLKNEPTARPAAATPPPQPELLWLEFTWVEL